MFGSLPDTNCIGECSWFALVLNRIKVAACNIACPHADGKNLDFISNGLAINYNRFINDLMRPFYV